MSTGFVTLIIVVAILGSAYGGYAGGLYEGLYGFLREFIAFVVAVTFGLPLSHLIADLAGTAYLTEGYFELISFCLLVIGIFGLGRWLRTQFTVPAVRCVKGLDEAGGALMGALHGGVLIGIVLVAWSMMPFVKYIPGDYGRVNPPAALDTGAMLLKTYGWMAEGMGGNDYVVYGETLKQDKNDNGMVDEGEYKDMNGNGKWDPGLLWQYRHHADIYPETLSGGVVFYLPGGFPRGRRWHA
jgi:hypothetical protein